MTRRLIRSCLVCLTLMLAVNSPAAVADRPDFALVIHGGSGTILKNNMTPEREAAMRTALTEALQIGATRLDAGESSLDAVEAVIRFMEDSPLFNAGRGAVFTEEGANEMDASIMDGRSIDAGAVAGVRTIRHPISAARAVMERSPHVMMAREGAESFADGQGLEIVAPEFFFTEHRWQSYQEALKRRAEERAASPDDKHGTVGCVALDRDGNLAAGTSTGGMTLKMWGRIGDSPVIGAGTYADNNTCGVSASGHGEYFIRNVVAYDVAARMKYAGKSVTEAAHEIVMNDLKKQGAGGGVVALDRAGNIAVVFNTEGMYRGYLKAGQEPVVMLYGPDDD